MISILPPLVSQYVSNRLGFVKDKIPLGFTRFFVDILTFSGSVPCVTKEKWKKGKREKQKALWVFFPFFLSITHEGFMATNHCNILIYQ
jgi:hypothetical protein